MGSLSGECSVAVHPIFVQREQLTTAADAPNSVAQTVHASRGVAEAAAAGAASGASAAGTGAEAGTEAAPAISTHVMAFANNESTNDTACVGHGAKPRGAAVIHNGRAS